MASMNSSTTFLFLSSMMFIPRFALVPLCHCHVCGHWQGPQVEVAEVELCVRLGRGGITHEARIHVSLVRRSGPHSRGRRIADSEELRDLSFELLLELVHGHAARGEHDA